MQAGLMAGNFAAMVIDNDMCGALLRANVPPEVTDETLDLASIGEVVRGEGHFLGRPETCRRMETDFFDPGIADRRPLDAWIEESGPFPQDRAGARAREILSQAPRSHLDPSLVSGLRLRRGLPQNRGAGDP